MVAHVSLQVLYAQLAVGYYPQGHVLGIGVYAHCPWQVAAHVGVVVEERPYASIAIATAREVGLGIGVLP